MTHKEITTHLRDLFEQINGYAMVLTDEEFDEACREHVVLHGIGGRPFMETVVVADAAKRALAGLRGP